MAIFLTDSFTDTNGTALTAHSPDTGGTWVVHGSSVGTPAASINASNRLAGSWNLYGAYYNDETPPSADYSVSVDLQTNGTSDTGTGGGVFARLSSASSLTCYLVRMRSNLIILQKYVSGTATTLGSVAFSPVSSEDYRMTLTCEGTSISVRMQRLSNSNYINSSGSETATATDVFSVTDSSVTAAGFVGITGRLTVYTFDNFEAATVGGTEYEEDVETSVSLSSTLSSLAYRVPLHILNGRITRMDPGDRLQNQDPDVGGEGGGGGSSFLITTSSDLESDTYYYYGGLDSNGDWKINRYLKTNVNTQTSADESGNGAYTTLAAAWTARESLSYA